MSRKHVISILSIAGWLLLPALATAQEAPAASAEGAALTGRQIMDLADARDDGDRSIQDMKMILIDKNGSQRKRTIRSFRMDVGEDEHSILFFLDPADVKDTGFLTYDYDDPNKDDDQSSTFRRSRRPSESRRATRAEASWAPTSATRT